MQSVRDRFTTFKSVYFIPLYVQNVKTHHHSTRLTPENEKFTVIWLLYEHDMVVVDLRQFPDESIASFLNLEENQVSNERES